MTPESKPNKSEWMQIAESDNASSNVRKVNKRLTIGTLASVGAIVIAGSIFANASDGPSAVADITSVASATPSNPSSPNSTSPAPTTSLTPQVSKHDSAKIQAPSIAQPPKGGDDEDGDYRDHEGRDGRGEHRDRSEGQDFGDDD